MHKQSQRLSETGGDAVSPLARTGSELRFGRMKSYFTFAVRSARRKRSSIVEVRVKMSWALWQPDELFHRLVPRHSNAATDNIQSLSFNECSYPDSGTNLKNTIMTLGKQKLADLPDIVLSRFAAWIVALVLKSLGRCRTRDLRDSRAHR